MKWGKKEERKKSDITSKSVMLIFQLGYAK